MQALVSEHSGGFPCGPWSQSTVEDSCAGPGPQQKAEVAGFYNSESSNVRVDVLTNRQWEWAGSEGRRAAGEGRHWYCPWKG